MYITHGLVMQCMRSFMKYSNRWQKSENRIGTEDSICVSEFPQESISTLCLHLKATILQYILFNR